MAWFDAGVNLFDTRMPAAQTIEDALEAGVTKICLITTSPAEWQDAQKYYQQYPEQLCYTLGVHPHHAKDARHHHWDELREFAKSPGVVAIGECGLDFNRDFSPREVQLSVFKTQIELACELKMPLYLHERDAFEHQFELLRAYHGSYPWGIAHCFTGDRDQMDAYLSLDLYIGVTGWLCDPSRGKSLREALISAPLDRLIVETDAPYLYPKTRKPRQRNNSPAYLPHIGETIADIKQLQTDEVEAATFKNSCSLFDGLRR